MPIPRTVLAVNSKEVLPNSFRTNRLAREVTPGTTLHRAAPSTPADAMNLRSKRRAFPSLQALVGIFICRRTRLASPRPTCVLLFPISKSRIMLHRAKHPRRRFAQDGHGLNGGAKLHLHPAPQPGLSIAACQPE